MKERHRLGLMIIGHLDLVLFLVCFVELHAKGYHIDSPAPAMPLYGELHVGMESRETRLSMCALCRPSHFVGGGDCYDPTNEICCSGIIYRKGIENRRCCGYLAYNPTCELCCTDGGVSPSYSRPSNGTLNTVAVYKLRDHSSRLYQCCGVHRYNPTQEICCDGHTHKRNGLNECCGIHAYNPDTGICCGGKRRRRKHSNTSCCGQETFSPDSEVCCDGSVRRMTGNSVAGNPCSLETKEAKQQCGDVEYDQNNETCCNQQLYPIDTYICCHGKAIPLADGTVNGRTGRCCGGDFIKVYDPELNMCCNEKLYKRSEEGCKSIMKTWYVSQAEGKDHEGCGTSLQIACKTLPYIADKLEWGNTLMVDGKGTETNPYKACGPSNEGQGGLGIVFSISLTILAYRNPVFINGGPKDCQVFVFNGTESGKTGEHMSVVLRGISVVNSTLSYGEAAITVVDSDLVIESCNFINNVVGYALMYVLDNGIDEFTYHVKINDTYFISNGGGLSVLMPLSNKSGNNLKVEISTCNFHGNTPEGALVVQNVGTASMNFDVYHTRFGDNQRGSGGAVYISYSEIPGSVPSSSPYLENEGVSVVDCQAGLDDGYSPSDTLSMSSRKHCISKKSDYDVENNDSDISILFNFRQVKFTGNAANLKGGALYASLTPIASLQVIDALFNQNLVNDKAGRGGAVFVTGGHVTLHSCNITDNSAPFLGGALYNDASSTSLNILNSTFVNGISTPTRYGELLFSDSIGEISISKSSFEVDSIYTEDITLLIHNGAGEYTVDNATNVTCPLGYTLAIADDVQTGQYNLSFVCQPCSENTYLLKKSYSHGTHLANNASCTDCPPRGNCQDIKVRATPNNWGYKTTETTLKFKQCPSGRCCTSNHKDRNYCVTYESCPNNRTRTLCSSCKKTHSNVLGSTVCVPMESCPSRSWEILLTLSVSATVLFLVIFILKVPLTKFIFGAMPLCKSLKPTDETEMRDVTEHDLNKKQKRPWLQVNGLAAENSDTYVKIIFFFYQAVDLVILERATDPNSKRQSVTTFLVKLFNFQMIPPFLVTCFTDTLNFKYGWALPENGFLSYIWIGLALVILSKICVNKLFGKCCKRTQSRGNRFLLRATMHMILLGNIVVARKMVVLLDCTEINGIKKFTYYGDITCDTWWWYPLVVYLMAGVVPLFLVVMHESKLLERKQIGHKRFLAACIIPLPFTVWWLVQSVRRLRKREGTDSSDLKSETKTKYFIELEVIQAPFQDGWRRFWEGALLFSRLLLLFCHLLIADILHRSLALMLVCVLIVIVHLVCQPFWSKAANCANILSLILLVLIAGFNFIDVLSQSYVLSFAEPEGPLNHVLEWLELAFVLLPFAIIVCAIGVGLICRFIVSTIKRKCSPSSYEKLESSSEVDSLVSDKSVHRFPPVYEEQHQNDSRGARPANKRTTSSSVLIDSGYQTSSTVSESNHRVKRGSNNKEASRPEETASAASSQRHSVDFSGDLLLENSKQLGEDGPPTRRGDVTTAADVHCSELECGPESPRERHLEVYNWRDDQAYILACLDQFNNIVSGLKDPGLLSSTNFTTNVFAAGQFDHEGGHLTVEQSGVNLFIPPGALSEHDEPRRIFVCVSVVDREYSCLTGNQTALTAVVRCGPQGLKFQKHVLLSIKHCTTPTDVSGSFKLWSSDTALSQPMKWCNASESGKALCICQGEDAISFISELSNFFVAREVNSMPFKMGGFFTRVSDTSTKLRIRLWRATAADTEIVNVKESSLRGKKISTDCEVLLHKNGKSLHVKLENLSSSWKILDDPIKIIPYDLIWQRSHNTGPSPVVTFLLETRRQGLLETPLSSSVTVTDDAQSLVTKFDVSEVNEHVV